jgi:prophage regulatory protein
MEHHPITGGKPMANQTEVNPLFIRRNQLKQITGLSNSTIWRLETEGVFPKRRKLSAGTVGWLYSEVEAFLNNSEAV